MVSINKNTTHRNYLFGDFDGDGVKNIDDYRPFNPKIKDFPDPRTNPSYYHKARFGGFDTKFSDVLLDIERDNNKSGVLLRSFIKDNPGSYGRVKTIPSTIEKLKKYDYKNTSDIAGATIIVENRKQVHRKVKQVKKRHRINKRETDDFYRKPKGGTYYAYHLGVLGDNDAMLEVQIKSRPMEKLHKEMHGVYKRGGSLKPFRKKAKSLFNLGF